MPNARIKSVYFSPHFFKSFQRLPRSIQTQAKKKDEWFRQNPFDQRLRTHKLKGELSGACIKGDVSIFLRTVERPPQKAKAP